MRHKPEAGQAQCVGKSQNVGGDTPPVGTYRSVQRRAKAAEIGRIQGESVGEPADHRAPGV